MEKIQPLTKPGVSIAGTLLSYLHERFETCEGISGCHDDTEWY